MTYSSPITTSNELTIHSVSVDDFGEWKCEAKNTIAGSIVATDTNTTLLTISCKYQIKSLLQKLSYSNFYNLWLLQNFSCFLEWKSLGIFLFLIEKESNSK